MKNSEYETGFEEISLPFNETGHTVCFLVVSPRYGNILASRFTLVEDVLINL